MVHWHFLPVLSKKIKICQKHFMFLFDDIDKLQCTHTDYIIIKAYQFKIIK